jgi:hypothetical protein
MIFFTSITYNYLPKASVLAESVRKYNQDCRFILVICEPRKEIPIPAGLFDEVLFIDTLGLPVSSLNGWIFKHSVVELCTAVKGYTLLRLLNEGQGRNVTYLDPDIVVTHSLIELNNLLETHSVLLTPHMTDPETDLSAIVDNEISCLKHGTYNLGFIAVKPDETGLSFAKWWCDRLLHFCYSDIPNGLFTDQRWVDLAPSLFDGIHVVRKRTLNVATWNLSKRTISGSIEGGMTVDSEPMLFFHFSGFDSGGHHGMFEKYGKGSPVILQLRDWYISRQNHFGQEAIGKNPFYYSSFNNGTLILPAARVAYRKSQRLQDRYQNPFDATGNSYWKYIQNHATNLAGEVALRPLLKEYIKIKFPSIFYLLKKLKSLS